MSTYCTTICTIFGVYLECIWTHMDRIMHKEHIYAPYLTPFGHVAYRLFRPPFALLPVFTMSAILQKCPKVTKCSVASTWTGLCTPVMFSALFASVCRSVHIQCPQRVIYCAYLCIIRSIVCHIVHI